MKKFEITYLKDIGREFTCCCSARDQMDAVRQFHDAYGYKYPVVDCRMIG